VPTPASNYLSTWPRLILGAHPCILSNTHKGRFPERERRKDVDPSPLQVVTIDQAGFNEPFALLNRADNEIAQD
jgi:hypothetical protein